MKKLEFIILIFSFGLLFVSCKDSVITPERYMVLDKVEYIKSFPKTYTLSEKIYPEIDIIGINDFCILDSMMVFSTKNRDSLWTFLSLPNYIHLGSLLKNGDGPFEFIQTPRVSFKTKFYRENNRLFAGIYDFQKGKLLKANIDESLQSNKLKISTLKDSLSPFLFSFIMIDSIHYFCKEVNANQTQQIRYIREGDKQVIPPVMKQLNQAQINENEDINILSAITKMSNEKGLIVEMPIYLNYINIYSLDDSFSKTICIGDELDDINDIEGKINGSRIYTYADLRLFKNIWGIVSIGEGIKTYQTNRTKLPSILLFDWKGKPLAKLKLAHFITSFDIDFLNGELYTFDVHTDEFFKYDINDILKELNIKHSSQSVL